MPFTPDYTAALVETMLEPRTAESLEPLSAHPGPMVICLTAGEFRAHVHLPEDQVSAALNLTVYGSAVGDAPEPEPALDGAREDLGGYVDFHVRQTPEVLTVAAGCDLTVQVHRARDSWQAWGEDWAYGEGGPEVTDPTKNEHTMLRVTAEDAEALHQALSAAGITHHATDSGWWDAGHRHLTATGDADPYALTGI